MKQLIITLALITFTLNSCHYDPHANTYTTYQPPIEEIVGTYELENIYMQRYSPDIGKKLAELSAPPTISLLADGTFTAERFPYYSEGSDGFTYKFEDFRTINSQWKLTTVGYISSGSSIESHHGISAKSLPTHLSSFGFTGTKKVDGLIIIFGDPDSGDAIKFKKKSE